MPQESYPSVSMGSVKATPTPSDISSFSKLGRCALFEIAIVGLIATALTFIAWRAFPVWDDGLIWLQMQHGGGKAVYDSIGDRPIVAGIYRLLAESGRLRELTAVVHWLTWLGIGL